MVELVDTLDSKSGIREDVRVRFPLWASYKWCNVDCTGDWDGIIYYSISQIIIFLFFYICSMAKTPPILNTGTLSDFIAPYQRNPNDNGSPEVQVAILSFEIGQLQVHVNANKHDVDSKRSLLRKVAKRRTLLRYLKANDLERYTLAATGLKLKV